MSASGLASGRRLLAVLHALGMHAEGSFEWALQLLSAGPAGVERWNHWRDTGARFLDLTGIDLSGAALADVNLRGMKLWDANLAGADLSGANLGGAYLNRADLSRARLDGAVLGGANFRGTNLQDASLEGATLKYALNITAAQLRQTVGAPLSLPS